MKWVYWPPEGSPDSTDTLGHHFHKGKPVEVTNERALTKLMGNRFFEAVEDEALEAKHRGRGSYSIMRGDDELVENLSKEDATTFNALSDEEKAEYVKGVEG